MHITGNTLRHRDSPHFLWGKHLQCRNNQLCLAILEIYLTVQFMYKNFATVYSNCTQYSVLYVTVRLRNTEWIDIVCNIFLKIPDCRTEIRINIAGIIIHKWKRMKWYSSSNGIQTQHWKVCLFVYCLHSSWLLFTNNVCLYFSTGRLCFHTAFQDPKASDDSPPRQSIEARGICFFPGKGAFTNYVDKRRGVGSPKILTFYQRL